MFMWGDWRMPYADLFGRDLITTQEWSREELDATLELAGELKRRYYSGDLPKPTKGQDLLHALLQHLNENQGLL